MHLFQHDTADMSLELHLQILAQHLTVLGRPEAYSQTDALND